MRRLFPLVLLLCGWAAAAASAAPVVMVFGDSLSAGHGIDPGAGWVALLGRRLQAQDSRYRVVNASISGDTTGGGLARLPAALARFHPTVVVLELGGNDGLQGLSLDAMRNNLAAMIRTARSAGARVLLVGMHLPPNYGTAYTERFHAIYPALARAFGVPLVPFLLQGVATDPKLMQPDGIHAAQVAQPLLLDNVWPQLRPLLGGAVPAIKARP